MTEAPDKNRARVAAWLEIEGNRERANARSRAHYAANRAAANERRKAHYRANREQTLANAKAKHAENPEVAREAKYLRQYGLTILQVDEMLSAQKGECATCCRDITGWTTRRDGRRQPNFVVDHNHNTGAVRELLCAQCNTLIGLAGENPTVLESVIAYLRKHSVVVREQ